MAKKPEASPRRKALSAGEFAERLLSLVRPLHADEVLKSALRAQLAAPHVTRFEIRLLEEGELVVAAGASRRLDARRAGGPHRLPASAGLLAQALASSGPTLIEASEAALLAPPADATRVCVTRLAEAGRVLGLIESAWDHAENAALDQRLLGREVMLAGHLALGLSHAETFERLRREEAGAAPLPGADREILRDADIRALERRNLLAALEASAGKISGPGGAAERLGVNASTLASRVRALGLRRVSWGADPS